MRPEQLEIEGFTAFRERTTVDFAGAELFAITGPTGAGKSSLIDAICFALYGSIPRLDRKSVEPVVAQGRVVARVRFTFSVDDQRYTAMRVVRRGAKGAKTTDARLEDEQGEVLAGTVKELDAAVVELLGLGYEHFTTCVVLPQGDFARFLHAEPRERRALLTELLALRYLDRLRDLAQRRAMLSGADVATLERDVLEVQRFATEPQRAVTEREIVALESLQSGLDEARATLEEIAKRVREATAGAEAEEAAAGALATVEVPRGVDRVGAMAARAAKQVAEARAAEDDTGEKVARLEAELAELPERSELKVLLRRHEERAECRTRWTKAERERETRAGVTAKSDQTVAAIASAREQAAASVDAARRVDRVAEFVDALATGQPCPVCGQVVHEVPGHANNDVAAALDVLAATERMLADKQADAEAAQVSFQRADAQAAEVRARLDEIEADLDGSGSADEVRATLDVVSALAARVKESKDAMRRLSAARKEAERGARDADEQLSDARKAFGAVRDTVVAYGPPPAGLSDLVGDWQMLVDWADGERPARMSAARTARERVASAEADRERIVDGLREHAAVASLHVDAQIDVTSLRDACVGRLQSARDDLVAIVAGIARVAELRHALDEASERASVAGAVAQHLKSDRFVQWVLDDVLRRLAASATTVLRDLSGGMYSLTLDERADNFAVIDHANADAIRPARTLSGGETFLASLALALALADQVRDLAAGGAARLETLFLDEGFGTLDPETLETVAGSLEALHADGRTVGIITHVEELAAAMPARFEVRKTATTATVERVV